MKEKKIKILNKAIYIYITITAIYLRDLAEAHNLFPGSQMGARKNRSTETALDLLLSQVRTTWRAGGVATLLSMDISGAYDNVVRERLVALLRQKGIPRGIVSWVQSFI
jgi:hypothetical protein